MVMRKKKVFFTIVFLMLIAGGIYYFFQYAPEQNLAISDKDRAALKIMPLPSRIRFDEDTLFIPKSLGAQFEGHINASMENAVSRFFKQISGKYTDKLSKEAGNDPFLIIRCKSGLGKDILSRAEQYSMDIDEDIVTLEAPGPLGILYGLETLLQLIESDKKRVWIRSAHIEDHPRYPWRGLMIDVCRHWIPKEVLLRNLDAMAAVKMNVLHLHLSDYQGFRLECKIFPLLHQLGSGGHYYTQNDIKDIIEYAADRSIRVIPEFDLPGHTTSWFVGYPELASMPGPYVADTVFGILDPVMDPTRESVYDFLDRFFEEMAGLFPDPYIHIGGDEVNPKQWGENPDIRKFMEDHGLKDAHELQAYFNLRLDSILSRHGKKMAGWDEILNPELPDNIVVQSWRSQKSLFEAARKGNTGILSAGYYLDHKLHAGKHYKVDPQIMPGAVDIEPDTAHWKVYDLTMEISQSVFHTQLTLYGIPERYRGFLSMMENNTPFTHAEVDGKNISFIISSDYGNIKFNMIMEGDSIKGSGKIGIFTLNIKGIKKGGDDMQGTAPPIIQRVKPLSNDEKIRVLGGEACMWTEVADAVTIESRIWPRTAAIAERLWSTSDLTQDVNDMYRRLNYMDKMLISRGLKNHDNYILQLKDLAGNHSIRPLKILVDILEEVKYYERMGIYKNLSVNTPLNRVVDAAWPESMKARAFNQLTQRFSENLKNPDIRKAVANQLEIWRDNRQKLESIAQDSPRVGNVMRLAVQLSDISSILMEALKNNTISAKDKANLMVTIQGAEKSVDGVFLAIIPGLKRLAEIQYNN
jgi:hexosaminidase